MRRPVFSLVQCLQNELAEAISELAQMNHKAKRLWSKHDEDPLAPEPPSYSLRSAAAPHLKNDE